VHLKKVTEARLSDLEWAEGIILGSPDYFGTMSARMKRFIDKWGGLWVKGKLKNKVGAVFTSADGTGTGAETTALSLVIAMVSIETVIVSAPGRGPGWPGTYGVIADGLGVIGSPDEKMLDNCRRLGKRVTDVARKLA
jgi:NAD(P)H dehydrogenase (quinone)